MAGSASLVALHPDLHRDLRVAPPAGDPPPFGEIVPGEIAAACLTCALFFSKDAATGEFYLGAMSGFRPGEVLVAGSEQGVAPFRSLDQQRQGFFLDGEAVVIDPAHPRFADARGEPLFEGDGSPAPALRHIRQLLGRLETGAREGRAFVAALLARRLIEPIDITLRFDDGEKLALQGLYTVSLDAVAELDDGAALELLRSGHLRLAYAIAASAGHVRTMAARRNHRLAAPAG